MALEAKFHRTMLSSAVAATISLPALPVLAQGHGAVEEVLVTSTRREQSVSEIPYNITALSAEQLERSGITDFTSLARATPGLTFTESGPRDAGLNSGLIIRGLNVETSGNKDLISTAAPTVSTYVGETPMFVNLYLKDISRVEVLRGPQGTLYGSGSLGGTIRYVLAEPEMGEFYGEVGTRLSSTKFASGLNSDTTGILNIPMGETLALRVVGGYADNQGFIDRGGAVSFDDNGRILDQAGRDPVADGRFPGLASNGDYYYLTQPENKLQPRMHRQADANTHEVKHGRVALAWDATDMLSARLTYLRQESKAGGRQAINRGNLFAGSMGYNGHVEETMEREIDLLALDLEADLGFASLSVSASHYENEDDLVSDQTPVYVNNDFYATAGYAHHPIDVVYGVYNNKDEGDTAEIRLVSQGDNKLDYVIGAFYLKQEAAFVQNDIMPGIYPVLEDYWDTSYPENWPQTLGLFMPDSPFYQNVQPEYTDKALFGELTWHVTEEWQITGGARFFKQKYKVVNDLHLLGCGSYCDIPLPEGDWRIGTGFAGSTNEQDFDDQIFKFNTSYNFNETSMVYFTWAEGFRHGGANAIVEYYGDSPELEFYDSDMATNWELGAKGTALDNRLSYTAALFLIDWEDMQFFALADGSSVPVVANAEEARSQGLELDATYYWTENFLTQMALTYTDAELTEDLDSPVSQASKGDPLPGVPEWTANLQFRYYQTLANGMELSYQFNVAYVDEIQTDFNPEAPQYTLSDDYAISDLSVTLSAERWEAGLFIDNVFDERAESNSRSPNTFNQFPYTETGAPFNSYQDGFYLFSHIARPRTAGVNLKYKF